MGDDFMIIQQVLDGDREIFRVLVERHSKRLFQFTFRLVGNAADADELVQESFIRAFRNLAAFDHRAQFYTWLYRIACNCAISQRRQAKPTAHLDDVAGDLICPAPSPEQNAQSAEIGAHVASSLEQLSSRERAAFVLRHFEGLSIREIGESLGLEDSATKNTIFRAVQKLRQSLAPLVRPTCTT